MANDKSNSSIPDGGKTETKASSAIATSVLSISIKDKGVLYSTYMEFIKPDGGLFIPTQREYAPGEKLALRLRIDEKIYDIVGRVVWVTPKEVHGARAPGVGIQFEGNRAKELNHAIKQYLGSELLVKRPTYTM